MESCNLTDTGVITLETGNGPSAARKTLEADNHIDTGMMTCLGKNREESCEQIQSRLTVNSRELESERRDIEGLSPY